MPLVELYILRPPLRWQNTLDEPNHLNGIFVYWHWCFYVVFFVRRIEVGAFSRAEESPGAAGRARVAPRPLACGLCDVKNLSWTLGRRPPKYRQDR